MDMHPKDRGARLHPEHGYLMIDGWPHCPGTPEELVIITRPAHLAIGPAPTVKAGDSRSAAAYDAWSRQRAALDTFSARIAERQQYAFVLHGKTTAGNRRFQCPARAGKVLCHGCPVFPRGIPTGTGLPETSMPPAPLRGCTAVTVTVKDSVEEKLRQHDYWGSPAWIASMARRSRIEASFGMLKGGATGALTRGWTMQVGLVRTSLLLAVAVAASNLRQLLAWARSTGDTSDELTTIDVTGYGFEEYDQHGTIVTADPPPLT